MVLRGRKTHSTKSHLKSNKISQLHKSPDFVDAKKITKPLLCRRPIKNEMFNWSLLWRLPADYSAKSMTRVIRTHNIVCPCTKIKRGVNINWPKSGILFITRGEFGFKEGGFGRGHETRPERILPGFFVVVFLSE